MKRAFCFNCTFGTTYNNSEIKVHCYVNDRYLSGNQLKFQWQCLYFMDTIYEENIPLNKHEHLLIKQNELDAQK